MREIHTEMIIGASAERVWRVLTDLSAYPEWNPLVPEAKGELVVGKPLRVKLRLGKRSMAMKPKLVRVEPNRALAWRGSLPIPGLFTGEHTFEIIEETPTQVRFHHWEKFNGLLVPMVGKLLEQTKQAFDRFNVALERRVTANESRTSQPNKAT
jgi:hypothetical protein